MKNKEKICDARCQIDGDCKGEVRRVHVLGDDLMDWGHFYYCEKAIKTDRKHGFKVYDA